MKNYLLIGCLLSILILTSCESTLEESTTITETSEILSDLELGSGSITVRENNSIYEGWGSASLENNETITHTMEDTIIIGTSTVREWFGANLAFGNDFSYDASDDSFQFESGGSLKYFILMSDDTEPFDSDLTLELGKSYPADIAYMDVASMEAFDLMMDNETFLGLGIQTLNLTLNEVTEEAIIGTFEGHYVEAGTEEQVPVSGEFNVFRTF